MVNTRSVIRSGYSSVFVEPKYIAPRHVIIGRRWPIFATDILALMTDFLNRIPVNWPQILESILSQSSQLKSKGFVAFDLDSTVFDNRPRQALIVREFGHEKNIEPLKKCMPHHFTSGWDLQAATITMGLTPTQAAEAYKELKGYWAARFFTSAYAVHDVEIVGAPRFVSKLVSTGVQVVYLTGRHEEMRKGTVECLSRVGLPVPNEKSVQLFMKPTLREDDDAYKRTMHARMQSMGKMIAAFDNEPTHINDYALNFPESLPIHLATDHSGRPVKLHERTISIPHFAY
jgi:hypothetical protein